MIAPNLIAVVGTAVAAQLIVHAGGIHNLSRMPSCNIQVVDSKVDLYFQ
jgi:U4/U6 small nuclear ribonucleoprotein PRP31